MAIELGRRNQSEQSRRLHQYDDLNNGVDAHHHTLGEGPGQAASGPEFLRFKTYVLGTPWYPLSFDPVAMFSLERADYVGLVDDPMYCRRIDMVHMRGIVVYTGAGSGSNYRFAELPENFRPPWDLEIPSLIRRSGGGLEPTQLFIQQNGGIYTSVELETEDYIHMSVPPFSTAAD